MLEPDLTEIFDMNSDWEHASAEDCKRGKLFPNMLAYHEPTKTLCVVVKRSNSGTDYALVKQASIISSAR